MEEQLAAIRRLFTRVKQYTTLANTPMQVYFVEAAKRKIIELIRRDDSEYTWRIKSNEPPL